MLSLETLSTIASTVMSAVVAVVALVFSYRQNVGWQPVALVTQSSMSGMGGTQKYSFHLPIEFWNRRKYPLVVRSIVAKAGGVDLLDLHLKSEDGLHVARNTAYLDAGKMVEPNTSSHFLLKVEFENQSLDAMQPLFDITVLYFDPHRNKTASVKIVHRMFYPELGWKKSEDERAAVRDAYSSIYVTKA